MFSLSKPKYRAKYRTNDGRADYRFSFEEQRNGQWRAFILSQSSYGSRSTGLHPTHRLTSGGRYYVCWDGPIRSLAEAKSVAAKWANCTQDYIRTGKRF